MTGVVLSHKGVGEMDECVSVGVMGGNAAARMWTVDGNYVKKSQEFEIMNVCF